MTTQIRKQDGIVILVPNGRIVGSSASELRKTIVPQIEALHEPRILINLENVHKLDSIALGVLVEAHIVAIKKKGRIGIVHLGKHIRNVIVITRLIHLFEVFDSEDMAVSALSA